MVNPSGKQAAVSRLLYELTSAIEEYSQCVRDDETFEVKKRIRLRLKEIEKEINLLHQENATFFVPNISPDKLQCDL
ncbi:MAG: hypothetical protein WDO19_21615 [Bacteroidota bacterium]